MTLTPTFTCVEAVARPAACAVIVVVPSATPVILGCREGCVCPALMITLDVEMVALLGSLLVKLISTSDAAGRARVIGKGAVSLGATVIPLGRMISVVTLLLITTVAGGPLTKPSLTINCTTNVPATSAVKV